MFVEHGVGEESGLQKRWPLYLRDIEFLFMLRHSRAGLG
jgi:hypothetical protein